jgi:hypothetical protein
VRSADHLTTGSGILPLLLAYIYLSTQEADNLVSGPTYQQIGNSSFKLTYFSTVGIFPCSYTAGDYVALPIYFLTIGEFNPFQVMYNTVTQQRNSSFVSIFTGQKIGN